MAKSSFTAFSWLRSRTQDRSSYGQGRVGRRDLLTWTGLGLGAVVTGCQLDVGEAVATSSSNVTGFDAASFWSSLSMKLRGRLLLPGQSGYDTARLSYNPIYDARRPAAVARCTSAEDVSACIAFAREHGVRLAARSGGHSYAGYSTPDQGLVVDVGPMNAVVDHGDGTATIGAGARLVDIYATLAASGRCIPGGSCPSVGISGLTLGGGIGVLSRLHGLTCDSLLSADIVLADGSIRTVDETHDPDLFWALRGGGGGNFGIVTSFTFRTYPAPSIVVFAMSFAPNTIASVLDAWQAWLPQLPNTLWTNCRVAAADMTCHVGGSFVGTERELQGWLDRLRAHVTPTSQFVQTKSYLDAMRYYGGCSDRTIPACHLASQGGSGTLDRSAFVASSRMLSSPIVDTSSIAALLKPIDSLDLLFDSLGGAVSEIAPDATAFPHRNAIASVQIYKGTSVANRSAAVRVVGQVQAALAKQVGGGAYINYIDPNQVDWAAASYGANLPRLQSVAKTFDPTNLFGFSQGVATVTSDASCRATNLGAGFSSINTKYQELGGCASILGAPVTDELVCPDGVGGFRVFERGSIYWSPSTGAHEVHGAIRDRWSQLGWEVGVLGYPTSDEYAVPTGRRSDFQRGSITWNATTFVTTVSRNGA